MLDLAFEPGPDVLVAIRVTDHAVGVRRVVLFQPVRAALDRVGRFAVRTQFETAHAVETKVRVTLLLHPFEVEPAEEVWRFAHAPRDHMRAKYSSPCAQCELLARDKIRT